MKAVNFDNNLDNLNNFNLRKTPVKTVYNNILERFYLGDNEALKTDLSNRFYKYPSKLNKKELISFVMNEFMGQYENFLLETFELKNKKLENLVKNKELIDYRSEDLNEYSIILNNK